MVTEHRNGGGVRRLLFRFTMQRNACKSFMAVVRNMADTVALAGVNVNVALYLSALWGRLAGLLKGEKCLGLFCM